MARSKAPFVDPHADREAEKYERPVPSREAILAYLEAVGQPRSLKKMMADMGLGDADKIGMRRRLKAMTRDGQLLRNRNNLYGVARRMDMVCGLIEGHPDGYGFVIPDGGGDDVFLSAREMRRALHGDRVMVRVFASDRPGKFEGTIVEVLQRNHESILGHYHEERGIGYVTPDDRRISHDILIPPGDAAGAKSGQIVVAALDQQPGDHIQPVGHIVEILGEHMDPGMEIEIAIRKYELPYQWSKKVRKQADKLPAEVEETHKQARLDLRDLPLVTIDGEDARDFDDAVFCDKEGDGWRLIVAIADVAHYVHPGKPLDDEARLRGNSVYFPRQVVPMLPEELSNGLCSLNPEVDRLCMACTMQVDGNGDLVSWRFDNAVMRSHARLTYTEVAAMLVDGDVPLMARHETIYPALVNLYELYRLMHARRRAKGLMELDMAETRILFDEQRKIEAIVPVQRNDAHRLIEEFMLAANVCAARFIGGHEVPTLYRLHAGPTAEKRDDLRRFLFELGLELRGGDDPDHRDYARLLADLAEREDAEVIKPMILRSLSQAFYGPDNSGHFALGFPDYTHFTSPIRRYPDLQVHRAIKAILAKRSALYSHLELIEMGEHCSMTERRADEATRDVVNWLKAEFMSDKVGEVFMGTVSGVTAFGLFVQLDDLYIDGLVHISALGNDYFHFDATRYRLVGDRSGRSWRLGDRIEVRLVRVDIDEAKIDLEPAEASAASAPRRSKSKRRRRKD